MLRSRRWPGAVAVGWGRGAATRWVNFYAGDGLELALDDYQLALPPPLPSEVAMMRDGGGGERVAVFAEQPDVRVDPAPPPEPEAEPEAPGGWGEGDGAAASDEGGAAE